MVEANLCISTIGVIRKQPFWKREKLWKSFEKLVKNAIINPVDDTIKAEKVGE